MVIREQVLDVLKPLMEPKFQKSMVDLNLVKDIMVKEDQVALTLVLTEEGLKEKKRLEQEAKTALKSLHLESMHIRFRKMTEFEQSEVERKLSRETAGSPSRQEGSGQKRLDAMQERTQAELKNQGMPDLLKPEKGVTFIAVASGKGGVGKSTVTVNLAVAMARKGKRVGIIDADIYGFSVPDMMGIEERPKVENEKIIPVERFGVKVMSMGFFVQDNSPVVWRGPMLGRMLRNFFMEVNWGDLDYVLLDLPPGTGDVALDVHQLIPQSKEIIVTTPHATAAFVAARAGAMAVRTHHEILGIIENMSYLNCEQCGGKNYVFGRGGGAKLAEALHTELLAQIPLGAPDNHPSEPDFSPSVYKENTDIGMIYQEIADRVIQKT